MSEQTHEITCPHCHKPFEARLMAGDAERYRGFKCPHCKLFVPAERAEETDRVGIHGSPTDPLL